MGRRNSLSEKFWSKVEIIPFHECWEWVGGCFQSGYGMCSAARTKNGRKVWLAHRLSLSLHGTKLINGLVVDHKCRNKKCVRPEHLRQVSIAINSTENSLSFSAKNKNKTHCPNGHLYSHICTNKNNQNNGRPVRLCRICIRKQHRESYRRMKNLRLANLKK